MLIFQRHDIYRVKDEKKLIILDRGEDALGRDITKWKNDIINNSLPLYAMVRRFSKNEDREKIPVGISSHIRDGNGNRFRMYSYLKEEDVDSKIDPYSLSNKINNVNQTLAIKKLYVELFDYAQLLNIKIGLYGSMAYEILTGNKYINQGSDLDLLVKAGNMSGIKEFERFYEYILKEEMKYSIRIDCEIEFKSGNHINMKELFMPSTDTVLNKTIDDVTILNKISLVRFLNSGININA